MDGESGPISSLRYRLAVTSKSLQPKSEIWVLLSQHVVNKDRALDDIALHVHEDSTTGSSGCASRTTVSTLERIASSVSDTASLSCKQLMDRAHIATPCMSWYADGPSPWKRPLIFSTATSYERRARPLR